ncbi:MAG: hypothetical protein NC092_05695 [Butyrivibrio sp.]|nr:hypothetical protein [Muribaculum sp.]MCM1552169.1 hypothetical protein [Butyrivibrio sp.]
MSHIRLADQVMNLLLNGEDEVLRILREQYKNAGIVLEEDNEAGFYINYYVDRTINPISLVNSTFQIGDVDGMINGIDGAVGFILYIKDGYLEMLEGYTNAVDKWPETDAEINLDYDSQPRNYELLRKKWG